MQIAAAVEASTAAAATAVDAAAVAAAAAATTANALLNDNDLAPDSVAIPVVPTGKETTATAKPKLVAPVASSPISDIQALTKATATTDAAAVKASAGVVADIAAAQQKSRINLLWEGTQAFLAIALTSATIVAAFRIYPIPSTLTNALFVVLGFYFGRTNLRPNPSKTPTEAAPSSPYGS